MSTYENMLSLVSFLNINTLTKLAILKKPVTTQFHVPNPMALVVPTYTAMLVLGTNHEQEKEFKTCQLPTSPSQTLSQNQTMSMILI
jgi:hypothetical protein